MAEVQTDPVAGEIIRAAIEVHHVLGPGLLESTYQSCLGYELVHMGMRFEQQGGIIVEVKSTEKVLPIHTAQVLTYLRLTGARQALLLNFNCLTLKEGLKSFLGSGNLVPLQRD